MQVHAFVDEGLGHSSYVIDLGDGTAALIDPPRFPREEERLLASRRLRLAWTLDTHSHADYVTGSPALAARTGATFIAPAAADLRTPHRPVVDGEQIDLGGGVHATAIATPGHTPDHHAFLLTRGGVPAALFSGGSLMVGTVGRTDLCGSDLTVPLARTMFRSLRRFDALPGALSVYPTHGAGSFCSAAGGAERITTLERERRSNPLFSIMDESLFVDRLLAGFGSYPSYFARLPQINRLGPLRYDRIPELPSLTPDDVERLIAAGGIVVDARPVARFAVAHLPGSLSIALRPVFGSWIGWLVEPAQPLVFVLDPDQDRDDLVRQCLDVGHELLAGELRGGVTAWCQSGRATSSISLIEVSAMTHDVIDVRQASEYGSGHVPGAINVELGSLMHSSLSDDGPKIMMCGHGERAMTAASMLAASGRNDVAVLDGGPESWSAATGRELERSS